MPAGLLRLRNNCPSDAPRDSALRIGAACTAGGCSAESPFTLTSMAKERFGCRYYHGSTYVGFRLSSHKSQQTGLDLTPSLPHTSTPSREQALARERKIQNTPQGGRARGGKPHGLTTNLQSDSQPKYGCETCCLILTVADGDHTLLSVSEPPSTV